MSIPNSDHGATATRQMSPPRRLRSINHYQETVENLLATGIGIEKYFSYVVIKPVFVKPHLDLSAYFRTSE
jgi:hypothetical protein